MEKEISIDLDVSEISGVMPEDHAARRVTITVYEKGGKFYVAFHLHERGDEGNAPRPEGYLFHQTEIMDSAHDLHAFRRRVKEEADARGIGHIRQLGF